MLAAKQNLIQETIAEGTGAEIRVKVISSGIQTGLRIWFADLDRTKSPIVDLVPTGLKRHRAVLAFGNYSGDTVTQMQLADAEKQQLARALVRSASRSAKVTVSGDQSLDDWQINDPSFSINVEKKGIDDPFADDALIDTCREIVTPLLGAMAELYGYDFVEDSIGDSEAPLEGAVRISVIRRRERNPRNRLLCLRIHGEVCTVCRLEPQAVYGESGAIIEVHHVQPLSEQSQPRTYDPESDLIPLCPNCHRVVHTRRPLPWTPEEVQQMMSGDE